MSQALHIFRKDVHYLRKEICLVLGLAVLFVWGDLPGPLLLVAAGYLIARLIHAETIPGDRQFWITRPYRWKSLLAAKFLFIFVFVNLPMWMTQAVMLWVGGFSLAANLAGFLGSVVLQIVCLSLPIAALAAVTPGIVSAIFAAFLFATLILLASNSLLSPDQLRLASWPEPVEWVRDAVVILISGTAAGLILYLQYEGRRTFWSRTLGFGAVICAAAAWAFLPPGFALGVQTHLSKEPAEFSRLQLTPNVGSKQLSYARPTYAEEIVHVFLPILVQGIPDGAVLKGDALAASLSAPDGRTSESISGAAPRQLMVSGRVVLNGIITMPRSFFNQEHGQPLALRAIFYGTVFGKQRSQTIQIPVRPTNVIDGLQCSVREFHFLYCKSAFRWPDKLVYAQFLENQMSLFNPLVSYSPFPAALTFNPFESHWTDAGSAQEVTIVTKEPLAHIRREFAAKGLRLVESTERQ